MHAKLQLAKVRHVNRASFVDMLPAKATNKDEVPVTMHGHEGEVSAGNLKQAGEAGQPEEGI